MRFWAPAALALYFLFLFRLTGTGLIGPDEPRYAWIGRDMARSGDWVTPQLYGEPWFEKPALEYWMSAAFFRLGFDADRAPRLPVACLSVLFLAFFYWRVRAEFGAAAAGYGSAVLATSAGWVAYSHVAVFDVPLAATFGAAMFSLLAWVERKGPWLAASAGFLGLAMLAKGLVGPALAALTILLWALRMGSAEVKGLVRPVPVLVFAAIAAPWYALCYARNGMPFLREFFWKHHVARFVSGALEHNQPMWFFVPVIAVGLVPWTPLLAALGRAGLWRERRAFFLALWAGVTIVFFSLSRDKLPAYVLPALPPVAALCGIVLARAAPLRVALTLCAAMLAFIPIGGSILPDALEAGLGEAIRHAHVSALAIVAVAAAVAAVWMLEGAGRRRTAVLVIAVAAVAGYVWIKQSTFPLIDQRAGTRALWHKVQPYADAVCLGDTNRRVEYGLSYYAGRRLPSCDDEPKTFRIDGREITSTF